MIDSGISSDFARPFESEFASSFESEGYNQKHSSETDSLSTSKSALPEITDFGQLEKLPNEGTTCHTYKWEWCTRVYFVKRLKAEFLHSPQHLHAFEKEFELGRRLNHPSLPRYVDFRHTEQECYIVMEYIDGKTLKDLWHKPVTADRMITYRVLNQLIDVLEYLHSHNVMHYDIIPQNVMLTTGTNNVMLIDLDKAFNSAYAKNHGNPRRFGFDSSEEVSSDVDFRGISVILSKGFRGQMAGGELKHFNDLCNKAGVTADELRDALSHKYDDVYVMKQTRVEGRTCDVYEGDWHMHPVMIKSLSSDLCDNKYYMDKFTQEFEVMNDCNDPKFAFYPLIRKTPEECFIVIEKPSGKSVSRLIEERHPWIYKRENIKLLLTSLLDSLFYLWEEGLDGVDFGIEDIFVNPSDDGIRIANFREILDTDFRDIKGRIIVTEAQTIFGEILDSRKMLLADATRPLHYPQINHIMNELVEGGVDINWLSDFRKACWQETSYRDLVTILLNSQP